MNRVRTLTVTAVVATLAALVAEHLFGDVEPRQQAQFRLTEAREALMVGDSKSARKTADNLRSYTRRLRGPERFQPLAVWLVIRSLILIHPLPVEASLSFRVRDHYDQDQSGSGPKEWWLVSGPA